MRSSAHNRQRNRHDRIAQHVLWVANHTVSKVYDRILTTSLESNPFASLKARYFLISCATCAKNSLLKPAAFHATFLAIISATFFNDESGLKWSAVTWTLTLLAVLLAHSRRAGAKSYLS